MTAEGILEVIRVKEHKYFIDLVRTEDIYDIFSKPTSLCRAKWTAMHELCQELGIEEI